MANEIHVGDIGTRLVVQLLDAGTPVDISTATDLKIILKGKGSAAEKTATLLSDGTDGKLYYDTQAGDIAHACPHKIQAKVTTPEGTWHSSISTFDVEANL